MSKLGQRITKSLKDAIAGDFSRVTIDGQTWVRATDLHKDQQEIMRINNELREIALAARYHVPNDLLARINAAVKS